VIGDIKPRKIPPDQGVGGGSDDRPQPGTLGPDVFATVVEVDNRGEDPEEGRRGLREELAPAIRPGVRVVRAEVLEVAGSA
jgi:hypothetical protein